MKRATWRRIAAVAACVLGVHMALWLYAQHRLAEGLAGAEHALAAEGIVAAHGPARSVGWPLSASRTIPDLVLRSGRLTLRTDRALLELSVLHPKTVRLLLPAALVASLPATPSARLTAAEMTLEFDARAPDHARLDIRLLEVSVGDREATRLLTVALAHADVVREAEGPRLTGSAQSIGLPAPELGESLPLGPRLASVSFDALLRGMVEAPFVDPGALAAWRDRGGAVEVRRLALGYGPLGLSAAGRFALDAQIQPVGTAALHIVGHGETLDTLVAARALSPQAALAVGTVLNLLARPPEGGGSPQVDTTLDVRDRVVSVAGFPLLRLPAVAWPQAR